MGLAAQTPRSHRPPSQVSTPTERAAVIEFEIVKQGILVEHILQSNGLYIQAGKVGDRLKHDLNRPKMLIEVPDTVQDLDGIIKTLGKKMRVETRS